MIQRRSPWNYHEYNQEHGIAIGEDYTGKVSKTIPDKTMTLKQLIERHMTGQVVPVLDAQYDDDRELFNENFPDVTKMSKIELLEFNNELKNFIENGRKSIQRYIANQKANNEPHQKANNEPDESTAPAPQEGGETPS
jgi:hypothetical protein